MEFPEEDIELFWSQVTYPDGWLGCWRWIGDTLRGYGMFRLSTAKRGRAAHRISYEMLVGEIPTGLDLDHLCHEPGCVNPLHLKPKTHRSNLSNLKGKGDGKFTSKHPGVSLDRHKGRWKAQIRIDGKKNPKHLGYFLTEDLAAEAYQQALKGLTN